MFNDYLKYHKLFKQHKRQKIQKFEYDFLVLIFSFLKKA